VIAERAVYRQFCAVAKPVLGRSLGKLLGSTQIAGKPESGPGAPADSAPAELSPGIGHLLRPSKPLEAATEEKTSANTSAVPPARASAPTAGPGVRFPHWTLLAADLLLVALALVEWS